MTAVGLPSFLDDFSFSENQIYYDEDLGFESELLQKQQKTYPAYPSPSSNDNNNLFLDTIDSIDSLDAIDSLDTIPYSTSLMMHSSPESSISSPTFYDLDASNPTTIGFTTTTTTTKDDTISSNSSSSIYQTPSNSQDFQVDFDYPIFPSDTTLLDDTTCTSANTDTSNIDLSSLLLNSSSTDILDPMLSESDNSACFNSSDLLSSTDLSSTELSSILPAPPAQSSSSNSSTAMSPSNTQAKPLRKQSESRISLPELYIRMGLGHDHEEARIREQRILGILRAEGFKLGERTWIRDTTEHDRRRIIDTICRQTYNDYKYPRELIEVIVRRGSYYLMQGRLRRIRRGKKAMQNNSNRQ